MLKIGKYSVGVTVLGGGLGTISIKIPGTFTTLDRTQSNFSCRELKEAGMFFGNPASGDQITSITLQDTDGLLPQPARAAFPNYPILSDSTSDFESAANQGCYIPTNQPVKFIPQGGGSLLPSGMYIVISAKKVSALVDTFYTNVLWDDRTG